MGTENIFEKAIKVSENALIYHPKHMAKLAEK